MLLRLINGAAQRKVDSGLKMLIEHLGLASGNLVLQKDGSEPMNNFGWPPFATNSSKMIFSIILAKNRFMLQCFSDFSRFDKKFVQTEKISKTFVGGD